MIWREYALDDVVKARSKPWLWWSTRWSRVQEDVGSGDYEMSWSGKARLAYGGVSCGAGDVQVVAHGFVQVQ